MLSPFSGSFRLPLSAEALALDHSSNDLIPELLTDGESY